MKLFNIFKYSKNLIISVFVVVVIFIVSTDLYIKIDTKKQLYNNVDDIPVNRVGLLLGTSKFRLDGKQNMFYQNRIDAAIRIFKAHKVEYILISGDNSTIYYNEPQTMMLDLLKLGIPREKMYLDNAGLRTFDSIIRAKEIFGQDSLTIISQQFHNERALFIANKNGIKALGYNAKGVGIKDGIKTWGRERFARIKMIIDLVTDIQPRYLGEKIEIN